ncbi:unnamed protein product [Diatraea saccharalis]|uniref:Platelet-derived growth factor (PDGF) family profile domain-containing protein n=1 Tax=Diatraea saccharalis TaxID=40085 RepID=A0A9N9RA38_9NEOP|nr:unnamed protein product [Diatraea saccharalis]
MAKVFLFVALFVIVVDAAHKHHPKFPKGSEEYDASDIKKVACSSENDRLRNEIIEKSRCGPPKEVFVYLEPTAAHEQVSPGAVWVKRCVGLCDWETDGSKCIPTRTAIRQIPVRIYNVKTDKETCSTYPVVEHVSCGCCSGSRTDCGENRVFNPRKCTCQCSNTEERRSCLRQRGQNMRWNRSKCACEPRRKIK